MTAPQTTRRAPQWARVLFELRRAGSAGITTNFIRSQMVPPIANPSQRILELEAQGHVISSTPEKREGHATVARYRLERDAGCVPVGTPSGGGGSSLSATGASGPDPKSPQATLSPTDGETFESLLGQLRRPAAYDPWNEAAA